MTRKEALELLGAAQDDYLPDLVDQKLFELKQYLVSKPVNSLLFSAQQAKLLKLHEVAVTLLGAEDLAPKRASLVFTGSQMIVESILDFERARADFRREVMNAATAAEVINLIRDFLPIYSSYLGLWPAYPNAMGNEVLMGKEPDPMELIASVREASELGVVGFEDLSNTAIQIPEILHNEWKRVSLLRQKEQEWKTSSES